MPNINYSPEKFGLRVFGQIDWSDGCYCFDYTTVWQDAETGALYFADDAGCSCPCPYEEMGRDDLTFIDRPKTFIEHMNKRAEESYYDNEKERVAAESGELIMKVRAALREAKKR